MSLEAVAKHIQSKGRNNDTMLVHMTPREVSGLQSLAVKHGGSLTINPKTGLPEAGFLDSLLPVVAGVVGSSFGLSPLMVAGGVGLATALATGDLGKGLTAGLGAYGGTGLGEALKTAGTNAVENAVLTQGSVADATAAQLASQAPTAANLTAPLAQGAAQSVGPNGLMGGANLFGATNAAPQIGQQAAQTLASQAPKGAFTQQLTGPMAGANPSMAQFQQGFKNVTQSPQAAWDFISKNPMAVGGAALPVIAGSYEPPNYKAPTVDKGEEYTYGEFDQGYNPDGPRYFNQSYGTPTVRKLAGGGPIMYPQSQIPSNGGYAQALQMPRPQEVVGAQDAAVDPYTGEQNYARGGITSLKGGRMLSGNGDGMSDSIPAEIDGGQPARLADGEFVVSSDVVSALGNGSSKAGANKLYDMMDRIRASAHGTKKQMRKVNEHRVLPA